MGKIFLLIGFLFIQLVIQAQESDAELILGETNITVFRDKLVKDFSYEIKINNRAGEKYTTVTIPYSKLNKLSNLEACIKDSDGKIIKKLKKIEIIERSSISDYSFYEDDFVKEFTLKHNSYPYTIVYSYQIQQSEFFYIDYWTPIIDTQIPTRKANLNVTVPVDYIISYTNQHVNSPDIDTIDNNLRYRWQASYTDIVKPEILSPSIHNFLPSVEITPNNFKFEIGGSFNSWNSYGDWQFELLQGLNELPDMEKSKILALIRGIKEDKEKIRVLYQYMQDATRYINITIETGGLKPYPASYVSLNKYGDCKALTNYFKSILDYIGIKSYYTKVYAGNPIKEIDKTFPSQQFNHVILYIPLADDDIWLDCTSDDAFNYLGTFTQNRDAFVIDKNNSRFMRTPALRPSDVLEIRKIDISYEPNQSSMVSFKNTYHGKTYEQLLDLERSFNNSDKMRILRNYFVNDGFELKDYTILKHHRDSLTIQLSYNASTQSIYRKYGNDILVSTIPFSLPEFEKPEDRKLPVQIDYPIFKIDTLVYEIPPGCELNKSLADYSDSTKFGQYTLECYKQKEQMVVIKSLLINTGFYPLSEYEDFYNFFQRIDKIENKTPLSFF